jgi:hypothetical protein
LGADTRWRSRDDRLFDAICHVVLEAMADGHSQVGD